MYVATILFFNIVFLHAHTFLQKCTGFLIPSTGETFELAFSAFCSALQEDLFMAVHSHCLCTFYASV